MQRWRNVVGAGVLALGLSGAGPIARVGPGLPEPIERNGLRFHVYSLGCQAQIYADPYGRGPGSAGRVDRRLNVTVMVTGDAQNVPCFVTPVVITRLTDEAGNDLLKTVQPQAQTEPMTREWLLNSARSMAYNNPQNVLNGNGYLTGLSRIPLTIDELRGYADCVVATKVEQLPIAKEAMEEPIEPLPGVRFLMTKFESAHDVTRVAYEWRVKRSFGAKDEPEPGLEPLVVGLVARDAQGNLMQVFEQIQVIQTRDEYIAATYPGDIQIPTDVITRATSLDLMIVHGLRRERFEFSATGIALGSD